MALLWKTTYVGSLVVIYWISFIMLTIGYFSPRWLRSYERRLDNYNFLKEECDTAGLISGQCRYPFSDLSKDGWHLGLILRLCFYFMLAAVIFAYTNALMFLAAVFLKMYQSEMFMSFFAISCGVFYPVAGVLTLTSSLFIIATYRKESGFSVICCCIAGCQMLLCYASLRVYDYMYIKSRAKKKLTSQR